jgi:hypothetical protein
VTATYRPDPFYNTYIPQGYGLWELAKERVFSINDRRYYLRAFLHALPPERLVPLVGTLLDLAARYQALGYNADTRDERRALYKAGQAVADDAAFAAAAATTLAVSQHRRTTPPSPAYACGGAS